MVLADPMVSSSCSESESESAMNWWLPPLVIDIWIIPQIVCGEQACLQLTRSQMGQAIWDYSWMPIA